MTEREIKELIKKEVKDKLELIGAVIESEAKKNIVDMKAVDTGRLLNSITHEVENDTVRIGTNLDYAQFVELGTYKMQPRPFLRMAIVQAKNEIEEILKR
jgi:HK97 gp10 family phage protein